MGNHGDQLGRLTTATGPWGSGSYTYDALGNLTTRTLGSRVVEMQYNASNRLHRHRDTGDGHVWRNHAYDSRGNVTNNGSISFTYDRAERPVSISGAASGSFVYDAHGRRVRQVTGGQTIYSVYSAGGTLLYRDNATTSTATDYIRLGTRAIARVRGSDVEWTHADHLGSPAAATSAAGAVLWREDHTPFGEARQAPAGNADNEGFTGHIADAATGLVYMQARYYDPLIGRFLSSDPVGFATGGPAYFNRYAYTANDPVNHIDPDGRAWGKAIRAGILLVRSGGSFREAGRQFVNEVGREAGTLTSLNASVTLAMRAEAAFNLVSPVTAEEVEAIGGAAAEAATAAATTAAACLSGPCPAIINESRGRRSRPYRCTNCGTPHGDSTETGRCRDCEGKHQQNEGLNPAGTPAPEDEDRRIEDPD